MMGSVRVAPVQRLLDVDRRRQPPPCSICCISK